MTDYEYAVFVDGDPGPRYHPQYVFTHGEAQRKACEQWISLRPPGSAPCYIARREITAWERVPGDV